MLKCVSSLNQYFGVRIAKVNFRYLADDAFASLLDTFAVNPLLKNISARNCHNIYLDKQFLKQAQHLGETLWKS